MIEWNGEEIDWRGVGSIVGLVVIFVGIFMFGYGVGRAAVVAEDQPIVDGLNQKLGVCQARLEGFSAACERILDSELKKKCGVGFNSREVKSEP